jgi:hypothetical protein
MVAIARLLYEEKLFWCILEIDCDERSSHGVDNILCRGYSCFRKYERDCITRLEKPESGTYGFKGLT